MTWRANIHDYSFVKGYRFVILQLKVKDDQTYIILFLELYLRKTRINEQIPFKYSSNEIPSGKIFHSPALQAFWKRRKGCGDAVLLDFGAVFLEFLFLVSVLRFYQTKWFPAFRTFRVISVRFSYVVLCGVYTYFCAVLRHSYPLTPPPIK